MVHPVGACIVCRNAEHIGLIEEHQQLLQVGAPKADVVVGVLRKITLAEAQLQCLGHVLGREWHQLHESQGPGRTDGLGVKGALLANDGQQQGLLGPAARGDRMQGKQIIDQIDALGVGRFRHHDRKVVAPHSVSEVGDHAQFGWLITVVGRQPTRQGKVEGGLC